MNRKIKQISLMVSLMALLLGACDIQSIAGGAASARGAGPPAGAQTEVRSTPEDNADPGGTTVESSSASAAAPEPVEETIEDLVPEDIPSLEERNAMLDSVNQGAPIMDSQAPVESQPPGTESGPAEDADVSLLSRFVTALGDWLGALLN